MPETTAILFALSSRRASITLDEFNRWYDVRHAPSRAACPGVHSVCRFQAEDSGWDDSGLSTWHWAAMYELESIDALATPEYKKARENDGDDETKMFEHLSRRLYRLELDRRATWYEPYVKAKTTRYVTMVTLKPDTKDNLSDEEFDKWYEEEHIGELSKCPGWLRSSRWQLVDASDPRTGEQQQGVSSFLALNEWDSAFNCYSPEVEAVAKKAYIPRTRKETYQDPEARRLLTLWKQF